MASENGDVWPRWPSAYERPLPLVDVQCKLNVDALFELLYAAGSEYVAKSQELRGNRDYVETAWVSDMGELLDAELLPPAQRGKAAHRDIQTYEGRLRKTSCSSFGMGMKFKTEEVQRCVTGQKGKFFEVEVCVATTATYGDKFRGVCRHRLQAEGPHASTWKAEFALVYTQSVNGLLKRAIEKGCASGLAKNFATLVEILGTFTEVQTAQAKVPLEASMAPDSTAAVLPSSGVLLGGMLNASFVQIFEPLAVSVGWSGGRGHLTSGSLLASGMALAVLLLVLEGTLDVGRLVLGMFKVTPVQISAPTNLVTIVISLALIKLAQVAIQYAAVALSHAAALVRRRRGARRSGRGAAGDADAEVPMKGTRFDGFDAALENASADIASAEHNLGQAMQSANIAASPQSAARQQLRSSVKGFQKLMSDTWTAGRRAVATGALSPERAVSPPPALPQSSPVPDVDSGDDMLSDDASPDGHARVRRRGARRRDRSKSPMNEAGGDSTVQGTQRAVELSTLGPHTLSFSSQTSSQLAAEERGVVEAEVFENERFLPFRGWGHEWPGHLLPTDRVGHWSLRGDRPSGAESMDFHRVAPALPKGWQWLDEDWHIDMTGHEDACVDNEGWCYAVDFNWLRHPPAPGSGRFRRVRDYVRRRRWVRTGIRSEDVGVAGSAVQQLVSMSTSPPPLLPLAELLGDSADVSAFKAVSGLDQHPYGTATEASISARASGSGDHSQAAGSANLDFASGQSGSLQPTPRLMYSTSRGLSLQESGVQLSDSVATVHLSVAESSDRPVQVRIAGRHQHTGQPERSSSLAAKRQLVAGRATESPGHVTHAGRESGRSPLPAPTVASTSTAAQDNQSPPLQGAPERSDLLGTGGAANAISWSGADIALAEQRCTTRSPPTEAALSEHDKTTAALHSSAEEAHQAALAIEASLQSGLQASDHTAGSISSQALHSSEVGPPEVRAVKQQVHASLEPSPSAGGHAGSLAAPPLAAPSGASAVQGPAKDEIPDEGTSLTQPLHAPMAPAATNSPPSDAILPSEEFSAAHADTSAGQAEELLSASHGKDAHCSQAPGLATAVAPKPVTTTVKASSGQLSTEKYAAAQTPVSTVDKHTDAVTLGGPQKAKSAEQRELQEAATAVPDLQEGNLQLLASGLESHRPSLKGLVIRKAPGERRPPSAAVSPTTSALRPRTAADEPSADASMSDQETLSPSAMSDSSDFGMRLQRGPSAGQAGPHAAHVDWNELGKRSSRLAALAGEGLRKGLRDMQQHAVRQTTGKREVDGTGGQATSLEGHSDVEHPSKRPDAAQRDASSSTFLKSLKARGEQSLNAARSALSPEASGPHDGHGERGATSGRDEQPGLGPSVRGIFSDLKRTMERVGVSPLLQSASTLGRRESSSSLRDSADQALAEGVLERQSQPQSPHSTQAVQVSAPERKPSLEDTRMSHSKASSQQSTDHKDDTSNGMPEVLSADEWGDFEIEPA